MIIIIIIFLITGFLQTVYIYGTHSSHSSMMLKLHGILKHSNTIGNTLNIMRNFRIISTNIQLDKHIWIFKYSWICSKSYKFELLLSVVAQHNNRNVIVLGK